MKTVYPLLTILCSTFVASGPVPIREYAIPNDRLSVRTEHLVEPPPAPIPHTPVNTAPTPSPTHSTRQPLTRLLRNTKQPLTPWRQCTSLKRRLNRRPIKRKMEEEHVAKAQAEQLAHQEAAKKMEEMHVAKAQAEQLAHQQAAKEMEAMHVAKAEAEAKAHQEAAKQMEAMHVAKAEAEAAAHKAAADAKELAHQQAAQQAEAEHQAKAAAEAKAHQEAAAVLPPPPPPTHAAQGPVPEHTVASPTPAGHVSPQVETPVVHAAVNLTVRAPIEKHSNAFRAVL
ncbi:uncharacterized protein EI97DRAFT_331 [Westerdykella ornata]|uniref:Uncharacterized protein n=1 Tax=Westerdykella ornata TaxID=318751 RepID=A0A6A6JVC9_WESOR|nr:uncharacterized protein EI97DRAFT_331 [Westerdykella ornata]KAF2280571.1 hypothetical protein EI97DRAFT_331 [Westerdykella ornata]